ncbi:Ribulose bisphosphate carboxylase small chain [Melia azedarach]|uniref:Ribulose bisphosphate carboxylase small chain n=1 Tax=Melia azedarach TaxID=155640 RepID=A0ACC1XEV9_MELAZ|nr:Ribulose bisphosphate carboxylase small chain [Melia azedarach]
MAFSMVSSATIASVNRGAASAQATIVAPFTGLKSSSAFPVSRKLNNDITSISSNGGKVQCMQVWPPLGKKKFETLSYLPPLSPESLLKEVDYLLRSGWIPCLEFELEHGFVYRENNRSPGYYDGRYWTMWKLPMFGCTDASQVLKELEEAKKAYPNSFIRIIGFDNRRQVQCISFIAYKPPGF